MNTNRGKSLVVIEGKEMITHMKSKNGQKQYWRCSKYADGCKARRTSEIGSEQISMTQEHSCTVGTADIEKRTVKKEMKIKARTNAREPTRNLVYEACGSLPNEVSVQTTSKDLSNLARMVQRQREIPGRAGVDTNALYQIEFNDFFSSLGNHSEERFLLWDSREDDSEDVVIFIFATDAGLDRLRQFPH
ncbi:hypothetical protein QR680_001805 [Steinernema hermaphroditum]|uniref:FLYWCH-type domain-containing protein n=1 Tax=Steinernema hermaphroditum TaxID=289476 RepID=A0AA39LGU9_9BILA|nr:hypothetical protein QR680_001805 [Steinernema hermaphroditum]